MRVSVLTRHDEVARQRPNTADEGKESEGAVYAACSIHHTEGRLAELCTIDRGGFPSQRALSASALWS